MKIGWRIQCEDFLVSYDTVVDTVAEKELRPSKVKLKKKSS